MTETDHDSTRLLDILREIEVELHIGRPAPLAALTEFSALLASYRQERWGTFANAARATGLSIQTLYRWERISKEGGEREVHGKRALHTLRQIEAAIAAPPGAAAPLAPTPAGSLGLGPAHFREVQEGLLALRATDSEGGEVPACALWLIGSGTTPASALSGEDAGRLNALEVAAQAMGEGHDCSMVWVLDIVQPDVLQMTPLLLPKLSELVRRDAAGRGIEPGRMRHYATATLFGSDDAVDEALQHVGQLGTHGHCARTLVTNRELYAKLGTYQDELHQVCAFAYVDGELRYQLLTEHNPFGTVAVFQPTPAAFQPPRVAVSLASVCTPDFAPLGTVWHFADEQRAARLSRSVTELERAMTPA